MEKYKHLKDSLMCCVEGQLSHLDTVDTKELGEAIDMIKDLEEAMYYCTITKAMTEGDKYSSNGEHQSYYPMYYRDMDRGNGRMYYEDPRYTGGQDMKRQYSDGTVRYNMQYSNGMSGNNGSSSGSNGSAQYSEYNMNSDGREGRSPKSRRMYMESKEKHADKSVQMRELENYMQELTQDVVEMVEGATQEEKQYLSKRVAALANKLAQLND